MKSGEVPAGSERELFNVAVRIAGALAELGFISLRLDTRRESSLLLARETDLPGVLTAMTAGDSVSAEHLNIRIERTGAGFEWRVLDDSLAAVFAESLRR